jgi:hypothetical protein
MDKNYNEIINAIDKNNLILFDELIKSVDNINDHRIKNKIQVLVEDDNYMMLNI